MKIFNNKLLKKIFIISILILYSFNINNIYAEGSSGASKIDNNQSGNGSDSQTSTGSGAYIGGGGSSYALYQADVRKSIGCRLKLFDNNNNLVYECNILSTMIKDSTNNLAQANSKEYYDTTLKYRNQTTMSTFPHGEAHNLTLKVSKLDNPVDFVSKVDTFFPKITPGIILVNDTLSGYPEGWYSMYGVFSERFPVNSQMSWLQLMGAGTAELKLATINVMLCGDLNMDDTDLFKGIKGDRATDLNDFIGKNVVNKQSYMNSRMQPDPVTGEIPDPPTVPIIAFEPLFAAFTEPASYTDSSNNPISFTDDYIGTEYVFYIKYNGTLMIGTKPELDSISAGIQGSNFIFTSLASLSINQYLTAQFPACASNGNIPSSGQGWWCGTYTLNGWTPGITPPLSPPEHPTNINVQGKIESSINMVLFEDELSYNYSLLSNGGVEYKYGNGQRNEEPPIGTKVIGIHGQLEGEHASIQCGDGEPPHRKSQCTQLCKYTETFMIQRTFNDVDKMVGFMYGDANAIDGMGVTVATNEDTAKIILNDMNEHFTLMSVTLVESKIPQADGSILSEVYTYYLAKLNTSFYLNLDQRVEGFRSKWQDLRTLYPDQKEDWADAQSDLLRYGIVVGDSTNQAVNSYCLNVYNGPYKTYTESHNGEITEDWSLTWVCEGLGDVTPEGGVCTGKAAKIGSHSYTVGEGEDAESEECEGADEQECSASISVLVNVDGINQLSQVTFRQFIEVGFPNAGREVAPSQVDYPNFNSNQSVDVTTHGEGGSNEDANEERENIEGDDEVEIEAFKMTDGRVFGFNYNDSNYNTVPRKGNPVNEANTTASLNMLDIGETVWWPFIRMRYKNAFMQNNSNYKEAYITSNHSSTMQSSIVIQTALQNPNGYTIGVDTVYDGWKKTIDGLDTTGVLSANGNDKNVVVHGGSTNFLYSSNTKNMDNVPHTQKDAVSDVYLGIEGFITGVIQSTNTNVFQNYIYTVPEAMQALNDFHNQVTENLSKYRIEKWMAEGVYRQGEEKEWEANAICVDGIEGSSENGDSYTVAGTFGSFKGTAGQNRGNILDRKHDKYYLNNELDKADKNKKNDITVTSDSRITRYCIVSDIEAEDLKAILRFYKNGNESFTIDVSNILFKPKLDSDAEIQHADYSLIAQKLKAHKEWDHLNMVTGFVDNYVNAMDYNLGNNKRTRNASDEKELLVYDAATDTTSKWENAEPRENWYNEGLLYPVYCLRYQGTFKLFIDDMKWEVVDPALCGQAVSNYDTRNWLDNDNDGDKDTNLTAKGTLKDKIRTFRYQLSKGYSYVGVPEDEQTQSAQDHGIIGNYGYLGSIYVPSIDEELEVYCDNMQYAMKSKFIYQDNTTVQNNNY